MARGLSQGQAASALGVSQSVYSEYERAKKEPRIGAARRIADVTAADGHPVPVDSWGEPPAATESGPSLVSGKAHVDDPTGTDG